VTWSARIEHTPAGLALTFGAPLSRLDMAPDVAQHLASLLAVEARHRLAGVVRTLEADAEVAPRTVELTERHAHFCDCLDCMGGSTSA
jgi:hypothetical protein